MVWRWHVSSSSYDMHVSSSSSHDMEALQAAVDANLGRLAFGWKGLDAVSPGMHTKLLQVLIY